MLKREDILALSYIRLTPFTGSDQGLRFRLEKADGEGEDAASYLRAWAWPEPYAFDHTGEEKKQSRLFSFDEEGIAEAVEWLNQCRSFVLNGS